MKFYAKRRNVKKRPAKKTVKKAIKTNSNRIFEKKVLKVIHKQAENKEAWHTSGTSLIKFNSGINATGDYQRLVPFISQGTADNQRIGDQIRAQSMNLKGYIKFDVSLDPALSLNNVAVGVRMMVLSLKNNLSWASLSSSATPLTNLLKKGGTTVGFTGLINDLMAPINTDLFTVHYNKVIYMNQSYVAYSTLAGYYSSDVKDLVRFFNIKIKCKNKLLKYDSGTDSGTLPTNFSPFLICGYSFLNGAGGDVVSTQLGLQYQTIFRYEDA